MLYFLGIIDTMDPVKAYGCATAEFVLRSVSMEFPDKQTIRLSVSQDLNFDVLHAKARALEEWIDVNVAVENRYITIGLKIGKVPPNAIAPSQG